MGSNAVWKAQQVGDTSWNPESPEDGELKVQQYCAEILDKELFDFWMESMEDVGYVFVMEDGAPYHEGCTTKRRKELMDVGKRGNHQISRRENFKYTPRRSRICTSDPTFFIIAELPFACKLLFSVSMKRNAPKPSKNSV